MAEQQLDTKIKGLFSTQTIAKVGTGTTQRKTVQKMYWYVIEKEDDKLEIQALNYNSVPAGEKKLIDKDDFFLSKTIALADRHRQNGETYSAEHEYTKALNIDEQNIKANFGLGLTYLERGEQDKANDILNRLVKLDAAFDKEHKHLFNEFGINLRKNKLLDESITYYQRAEELAKKDENLYYNMARVYFDKEEMEKTAECLQKALAINKDFEAAQKFIDYLKKKKLIK